MCYLPPKEFINVGFLLYDWFVNKKLFDLLQVVIPFMDESMFKKTMKV